ncbi:MAG: hypothetical protein HZB38_18175 [Planctomycetes bacterium]|nr:hypothetical protein [Planctomycetota bacterium]
METTLGLDLERTLRGDRRYDPGAYHFLIRGLEFTSLRIHGERTDEAPRHVSGGQLCEGLRDFAHEQWGLLAPVVLERWGVRRTRDFGEMVFRLIELGVFGKQPSDRIEDFDEVFAFADAFSCYPIAEDALEAREPTP